MNIPTLSKGEDGKYRRGDGSRVAATKGYPAVDARRDDIEAAVACLHGAVLLEDGSSRLRLDDIF